MSIFATRLKEARKESRLSQEDASRQLDIRYSTYRRYETGVTEPTVSTAARMARLYGVSLDYLAGLADEPLAK